MKRIASLFLSLFLVIGVLGVTAYAEENTEPLQRDIVLMLDTSGSMSGTPFSSMKTAAAIFCEQLLESPDDNRLALVAWTDSFKTYDFTSDIEEIKTIISGLSCGGGTDTAGALQAANNLMLNFGRPDAVKNIVLLTDGLPEHGTKTSEGMYGSSDSQYYAYANTAYNVASEITKHYSLYTLGFFHKLTGTDLTFGKRFLNDIQNAGYYEVSDPNELVFKFGEVADDISNDGLKKISFTYGGGDKADCYFSNDYFAESSYEYNQSLGTMSLAFAMSAFGNDSEPDYANKSINAKELLMDIGVSETNIETNDWFTVKPTTDSIGVIAGNMPIRVHDTDYTLIALAVRGGGYEREWASNFTIGTSGQHDGFDTAKDNVISFLRSYIDNQNITGPVKIWITGFSRAAATSNLVGGEIDKGVLLSNNITYSLDDVYTYCFETPAGALTSQVKNQSIYSNIFNIINSSDPVPYVAPAAMGFGRYGKDKYLPSKEADINYMEKKSAMLKILNSLAHNNTYIVDEFQMKKLGIDVNVNWDWFNTSVDTNFILDDTDNNYSQGTFLSNYVTIIAKEFIKNRSNYVLHYQDEIREICSVVFGCTSEQSKLMMESIVSQAKDNGGALAWAYIYHTGVEGLFPWNDKSDAEREDEALQIISDWLQKAISDAGITDYSKETIDKAGKDLGDLALALVSNHPNYFTTAVQNASGLGSAHYTELCFAWMASMDPNYETESKESFNTGSYRIIRINCPVDVSVYDENGDMVAAIVNEAPQFIESSSIIASINDDGEKLIVLPIDCAFDITIYGRESGTVDYGIDEYCALAGDYTRAIDYFDVYLEQGESLYGYIPAYDAFEVSDDTQLIDGSTADYTLVGLDNSIVTISSDLAGDNAVNAYYSVISESSNESYGVALGSGLHQYGNYAQVEAYAKEGYKFSGWYENGVFISNDNIYRFRVTDDIELKACFIEESSASTTAPSSKLVDFVTRLYECFLSRKPDDAGLKSWVSALQSGMATGTKLVYGFVYCKEFQACSLSNDSYVKALYKVILGRDPDQTGLDAWLSCLKRGYSKGKVLEGFLNSVEMSALCAEMEIEQGVFRSTDIIDTHHMVAEFVMRLYENCLGRSYDEEGLHDWVDGLVNKRITGTSAANGFFKSREFLDRELDNWEFVRTAYRTLLNREPDEEGLKSWVFELEDKSSGVDFIDGFTKSVEFGKLCEEYGIKR